MFMNICNKLRRKTNWEAYSLTEITYLNRRKPILTQKNNEFHLREPQNRSVSVNSSLRSKVPSMIILLSREIC